ncbi:MAG: trehalose-phosphatase [Propionibacteriaceae bacterium]|nr:trehalose-phosphatase [Propionibacteriaceae bacterium]
MTVLRWQACTGEGEAFLDSVAADPGGTLLAMDFDGTLAPIVDDPESSRMHEGAAAALARLGSALGKIAIITGREVSAVRRLGCLDERAGLERVSVLGQYGVERYDADTGAMRMPPQPDLARVERDLGELISGLGGLGRGVRLEHKGRAIGVHTRLAADPARAVELLTGPVTELAARHGLRVEPGKFVLELRSSTMSKGDALNELVTELRPTRVAMLGDDHGDRPAFELLPRLRGDGLVCCAVFSGSDESPDSLAELADVACDGPDGVAAWLSALADALESAPR